MHLQQEDFTMMSGRSNMNSTSTTPHREADELGQSSHPCPHEQDQSPDCHSRQKSKISWRGKTCWVSLPRSSPGSVPLSPAEVRARLERMERAGLDTEGFDLDDDTGAQSRAEYLDHQDLRGNDQGNTTHVRIPDLKAWSAYVDGLTEQKLRALGVSTGLEPPQLQSQQTNVSHGRRSASPAMTISVGAMQTLGSSRHSTPSLPSFGPGSFLRSPSFYSAQPYVGAFPAVSPLSGPMDHLAHAYHQAQFAMSHGFLPEQTATPRIPSPIFHGLPTSHSPALSPCSTPFQPSAQALRLSQSYTGLQALDSQFLGVPTPTSASLTSDLLEDVQDYFGPGVESATHRPEIMVPTPLGHRHNISQTLDSEIRAAENHVEQITNDGTQQDVYEAESPAAVTADILASYKTPTPATQFRVAQEQQTLLSKSRASKLSVAAPEFKFNPGANMADSPPQAFNFGAPSNVPSGFDLSTAQVILAGLTNLSGNFGNVLQPEVVLPRRGSKAIAIVKPEKLTESDNVDNEDEDGRPVQSTNRLKRACFTQTIDDSVPLFAESPSSLRDSHDSHHSHHSENDAIAPQMEEAAVDSDLPQHVDAQEPATQPTISTEARDLDAEPIAGPENALSEEADSSSHVVSGAGKSLADDIEPVAQQLDEYELASMIGLDKPAVDAVIDNAEDFNDDHERDPTHSSLASPRIMDLRSPTQSLAASPLRNPFSDGQAGHAENTSLSEWSPSSPSQHSFKRRPSSSLRNDRLVSIVGSIVKARLQPLEKTLDLVQHSVSALSQRTSNIRGRRPSQPDSDADDEDDEGHEDDWAVSRPISWGKEKKMDLIKSAVTEALALQQRSAPQVSEASEIYAALVEMRTTLARFASVNPRLDDIRAVVEQTLHTPSMALIPATPEKTRETHKRQVSELEGRLNETLAGAIEEANQRHIFEAREAESRKMLRLAKEELALMQKTVADKDSRIQSLRNDCQEWKTRAGQGEKVQRSVEKQLSDCEAERAALESTLDEYRTSSTKWRQDVDRAEVDNLALRTTIRDLQGQLADGVDIRDNMRIKLDKIGTDMATAVGQLASEKAIGNARIGELQQSHAVLQTRLVAQDDMHAATVQDLRRRHEEELYSVRAHDRRELAIAHEDKQRADLFSEERLSLSKAKSELLQDKISLLEERLEIAKSAAQAAVSAAQAAKAAPAHARDEPERISPQALRESILVLQDQLQERERRIERLQSELASIDTEAPAKLKERDIEISWLRELLAVRGDDVTELIRTLSAPDSDYNRESVRDTAIRMQATLRMEQEEKERLIGAGASLTGQALAGLTNFASPKAVQLAAAIGNWRNKGRDSGISMMTSPQLSLLRSPSLTPSKPSPTASSFLAGLMTPPTRSAAAAQRQRSPGSGQKRVQRGEPATPLAFRKQSFDDDAEIGADAVAVDGDEDVENRDPAARSSDSDAPIVAFRSLGIELS